MEKQRGPSSERGRALDAKLKEIGQRLQTDFDLDALPGQLVVATCYAALRSLRLSLVSGKDALIDHQCQSA